MGFLQDIEGGDFDSRGATAGTSAYKIARRADLSFKLMNSTFSLAHPWLAPLRQPLLWSALCLTLVWDRLGLDHAVMAAIGSAQGFALRHHPLLATVLHDWLKDVLLLLYLLAWLLVFWPRGPARGLSRRQRWVAIAGVSASLLLVSTLKRFSATSCPWDWQTYGGTAQPISFWAWGLSDGGPGHCFPGGHASSALAFWSLAWVAMSSQLTAVRRWGRGLGWVILAMGVLMGVVQTLRGAHPPSHTLWTAWICAAVGWVCACAGQLRARTAAPA
jgi:membrane-associated PAP2 superfamily phosphatase